MSLAGCESWCLQVGEGYGVKGREFTLLSLHSFSQNSTVLKPQGLDVGDSVNEKVACGKMTLNAVFHVYAD